MRKKRLYCSMLISIVFLTSTSIIYLNNLSSKDPKWLIVGQIIKSVSSSYYGGFKDWQKRSRIDWFDNIAMKEGIPLHVASGYSYMSEEEYSEMVLHVLDFMPIRSNDSLFELGCGVGAVLQVVRRVYGQQVLIGGSDSSTKAITKIREVFPNDARHFYLAPMTQRNYFIKNDSKDHVFSFGAMAMYLYRDEMTLAIEEALRITRPGGHLCITHFIEPDGILIGSILEPVEKSYWSKLANRHSLENLIVKQMIHQKDRYFVCFSKPL